MNKLEKLVSNYMKTCETMKKLDKKTLKAYRIWHNSRHLCWDALILKIRQP